MNYVKFVNDLSIKNANVKKISEHVVQLSGVEKKLSGFYIFNEFNNMFGDYSNYKTLYRELENSYQLSNDGSVYVEPEPIPEYEPTLDEIKEQKVQEMNQIQQTLITQGTEVELSDGSKEKFTLNTNDQLSLNSLNVKSLEGLTVLPWHPADESVHCKFYSEEDMKRITDTCMNFVAYHVTYFRDLRIYIRSLQTKEEVNAVEYGIDIPIEYQSEVLQALLMNELSL